MPTQLRKVEPPRFQTRRNASYAVAHRRAPQSLIRARHSRHREAAFKRGNRHLVAKEAMKAISCYRRAANAGHAGAQYNLGLMYLKGESVPRDALYGLGWLAKAADGGDKKAQELLQRIDRALVGNRKIAERI